MQANSWTSYSEYDGGVVNRTSFGSAHYCNNNNNNSLLTPGFFYIVHMYSECDAFFMWEMDIREASLSALAVGYPIDYT